MKSDAGEVRPNDGCHPLKAVFRELRIRQLDVARHCKVTSSSLAHYLNGYRAAPVAVESKMQSFAAQKQREHEAKARAVTEHGE
jgi:hypothetical protein